MRLQFYHGALSNHFLVRFEQVVLTWLDVVRSVGSLRRHRIMVAAGPVRRMTLDRHKTGGALLRNVQRAARVGWFAWLSGLKDLPAGDNLLLLLNLLEEFTAALDFLDLEDGPNSRRVLRQLGWHDNFRAATAAVGPLV